MLLNKGVSCNVWLRDAKLPAFWPSSSHAPRHTNISNFIYNHIRNQKLIVIIVDTSYASKLTVSEVSSLSFT